MNKSEIKAGKSFPIGATLNETGVNFSLFSKNAQSVELLLFDHEGDRAPAQIIPLHPKKNKTYHYWHIQLPGLEAGQLYAYRVNGPHDTSNGHRFNPEHFLLDPYAKAVTISKVKKNKTSPMKCVVSDSSRYDWESDQHPRRPFAQTIIYEMHVAGFTKNPNSGVAPKLRGTYAGLIEKIPYLIELGITAVELLPVFLFDHHSADPERSNYWGYSPISFFAVHTAYSSSTEPLHALDEFRDMVKALHKAGIEVILDVVYNHTGEGGEGGPTYSLRGIDNSIYYTLTPDKAHYADYSGCGNTLNANHPIVRRMIIDSLHYWVKDMHIDGFRFDLASILSRDEKGMPVENPPILWDIESDPVLAGTKLIAEAWDAAGLYQVGSFIGDSWKEWNGKFRDDVRSFLKGDRGTISRFASRIMGSPDMYAHQEREPEQSINFVTCHDGFTLNDLVSYNTKHNGANGEGNRDGTNDNLSWNFGIEGPTDDPVIEALRNCQIKNFFTLTLLSVGAPMMLMGDEVRRTQRGNNNAYCQDNEISWFDWSLVQKHSELLRYVKLLLAMRLQRDTTKEEFSMSLRELLNQPLVTWHGVKLNQPDWSDDSHSLAITVQSLSGKIAMHYMINAWQEPLDFELPVIQNGVACLWKRWIDTSLPSPNDICHLHEATPIDGFAYDVKDHSMAILITEVGP
ncbi:MAG: glycogen debranching protein GlgX [Cyclobacteriaceae bacterium]|nr:glycogen debranching protein GlgX [Cyclobacteriaceae bacterium]